MPSQAPYPSIFGRMREALLSRRAHLIMGALTVLAVLFAGFDATRTRPSDGTVWRLGRDKLEVLDTIVGYTGPATPLRKGDRIIGLGKAITPQPQQAVAELRRFRPGQTINYLVQRGNDQDIMPVPLGSTRVDLREYSVNIVLALIYLIIGFAVYLRSNNERPANLFFTLCLLFSLYFTTNLQQVSYFLGALITQNIGALARFMLPAVFLHFFLVFPSRKATLLRHPFLSPLIYLLPLMFSMRFTIDQFVAPEGGRITSPVWLVLGVYYVLGLAALLHGYLSYRDPLMRDRVRILTYGTMLSVIPFLVFKIGLEELSYQPGLARLGAVPLAALPISFGYCVARYRILQIDLLIKRNLAYGALTIGTWLGYFAGAWWLGSLVLAIVPGESPLIAAGAMLAVAAGLWPARLMLQGACNRRFYHSRGNLAAVIGEISREIPRHIQSQVLFQKVGVQLRDALGLPSLAFYLGGAPDGAFTMAGSMAEPLPGPGYTGNDVDEAPAPGPGGQHHQRTRYPHSLDMPALTATLAGVSEPLWIDTVSPAAGEDLEAITREQALMQQRAQEQLGLAELGIQLLVPMTAGSRLVGVVALPVRPGLDYELHEMQLLTIVAGQIALQIENSRLYEEEVGKRKMEEELAMARRIQSRLLPGRIPQFDGIEIHAVNISSKQVSGDYYDLIERRDGKLALVIADVSGKGMPASILASNLQAAVRAQVDMCDSPAEILDRINRQIHASTDPEHFATLFLGIFDPISRDLVYCSGGHNSPVIIRADGTSRELDKGGMPLGAFDFSDYEEESLTLDDGDLLFLYTDGLTETKGPDGDEDFGEDRMTSLLRTRFGHNVDTLIDSITEDLAVFSGRRDHDDDITMIALKIGGEAANLARAQGGGDDGPPVTHQKP